MPRSYPYTLKINGLLYQLMSVCENAKFSYLGNCVSSTDFIRNKAKLKVISTSSIDIAAAVRWDLDTEPIPRLQNLVAARITNGVTLYQYSGDVALLFRSIIAGRGELPLYNTVLYGPGLGVYGHGWIRLTQSTQHAQCIFKALRDNSFELEIGHVDITNPGAPVPLQGYVRIAMRYGPGLSRDIHTCLLV